MDTDTILGVLVLFQVKHFLTDFVCQTRYMLGKFNEDWSFFWPLVAHSFCVAAPTYFIVSYLVQDEALGFWMAAFDFATHFVIDRLKAGPKYFGRYRDTTKPIFWNALGADQMLHGLVYLAIVWYLA